MPNCFCLARLAAARKSDHPDEQFPLLGSKRAPKRYKGKFVRVLNELAMCWTMWAGIPPAEIVQAQIEEVRNCDQGIAAGDIMAFLEARER